MQCRRANSNSTSIARNQSHTRTLFVVANTINAASRENEGRKNGIATIPRGFRDLFEESEADPVSHARADARRERELCIIKRKSRFNIQFRPNITLHNNKTPIDPDKRHNYINLLRCYAML